jgi:hypothetical protein
MKLYVINRKTHKKHVLQQSARTKAELATLLGSRRFTIDNEIFSVDDVIAEPSDTTASAMALGGLVGVAGGVPGVIVGGIIGGLLGKGSTDDEKAKAEIFNRSLA